MHREQRVKDNYAAVCSAAEIQLVLPMHFDTHHQQLTCHDNFTERNYWPSKIYFRSDSINTL